MTNIHHDQATVVLAAPEHQSLPTHVPGQASAPSEHSESSAAIRKQAKIMIVDDEPINIKVFQRCLKVAGYENFITITDSTSVLETVASEDPDIILLDIMMPKMDGLEILERIRANEQRKHIPIVILTALNDQPTKQKALELGATDFLAKPVDPSDLIPRVRNALLAKAHYDQTKAYAKTLEQEVRRRTEALAQSRLEVIHCLGRAAEYRDNETGQHVIRVGRYVGVIARGLGLDETLVELLEHASPLHDVGKIGIPDAILLKPGKLTPEEFEMMQKHCQLGRKVFHRLSDDEQHEYLGHAELGAKIMGDTGSPLLKMAGSIALSHHEKWDGSGYPLALAGEDIPIEGRITSVADVFDALSSKRPYKPAFPREKCFAIMEEGRGKHFDPSVLDVFFSHAQEIIKIQIAHADLD
ncbi:MAG: response regulator [Phycisphaerae bacterium]|nr:response regulator [Phycisphaerae bacterium]